MGKGNKEHNDLYNELQDAYLAHGDTAQLGKMYEVARQVARNYVQKYCRTKKLYLDVEELSHDAAMYLINRYLRPVSPKQSKPFYVKRLSAYIYFGVMKVLYADYKKDVEIISYEDYCSMRLKHEKISL
ncbi:MAG: hypothetical protein LBU17_01640 [Treponema sp.]|jgi:hypothetical protein|nr:hypothetical protein [Treponema sp.]